VPSDGKICNLGHCFNVIHTRSAKGTKDKRVKGRGKMCEMEDSLLNFKGASPLAEIPELHHKYFISVIHNL
jgi:hypothetical protein